MHEMDLKDSGAKDLAPIEHQSTWIYSAGFVTVDRTDK